MSTRKHKSVSLAEKNEIIKEAAKKNNKSELAKRFNLPRSTIINILNNKEMILQEIHYGGSAKRARLKKGKHKNMEEALVVWIKQVLSQNIPVTGDIIKKKALEICSLLNIEGFEASNGSLEGFKNRFSIKELPKQGEASSIHVRSLKEWQQQVFHEEIPNFFPNDIFNADETALFWQLLPNKTLTFKKCIGGNKSKHRVTVLVGANMSGSENLPLFVIGKSANPCCFKNACVPVEYIANQKKWMTGVAFEAWIKAWDKKIGKENRKVLLYIDNCSAHPQKLSLQNLTVKFFPPNTTAMSQRMDQGIIQNPKVHYRRFLLKERIKSLDQKKDANINLLNALYLLRMAWSEVKPTTIANCFRHAAFNSDPVIKTNDEAIDELLLAWAQLKDMGGISEEAAMRDYISVDNEVITGLDLSVWSCLHCSFRQCSLLQEIVGEYVSDEGTQMAGSDSMEIEEDADPEEPAFTSLEAMKTMEIFLRFFEKNFDDHEILKHSDALEEAIYQYRSKKRTQKKSPILFPLMIIDAFQDP